MKFVILLIGIIGLCALLTYSVLNIQESKSMLSPTMLVTNVITDERWNEHNELLGFEGTFWFQLNFSFPQQEMSEHPLRNFYLATELAPNIHILDKEQIRVYTVKESVDVTDYFDISTTVISTGYHVFESIKIVAIDTALTNAKFYERGGGLYVAFEVEVIQTKCAGDCCDPQEPIEIGELMPEGEPQAPIKMEVPLPEEGTFDCMPTEVPLEEHEVYREDLIVKNSFRIAGEFFNGDEFFVISNNVYTKISTTCFQ